MTVQLESPAKISLNDLMVAILALLFLLIARPLLAEAAASNTLAPINASQTVSPSSTTIPSYLTPDQTIKSTDSQSHREASARQNGGNSLNPQAMPECRVDDAKCIEQRNQLNQTNPQTAPTFNR